MHPIAQKCVTQQVSKAVFIYKLIFYVMSNTKKTQKQARGNYETPAQERKRLKGKTHSFKTHVDATSAAHLNHEHLHPDQLTEIDILYGCENARDKRDLIILDMLLDIDSKLKPDPDSAYIRATRELRFRDTFKNWKIRRLLHDEKTIFVNAWDNNKPPSHQYS